MGIDHSLKKKPPIGRHFIVPLGLVLGCLIFFTFAVQAHATTYPGQPGNSVGYAAYGTLGTTPWPGGSFQNGTVSNPTVYTGYVFTGNQTISGSYIKFVSCDFNSGTGGVNVTGSNITFTGDRFQSNQVEYYNVITTGANITFSYDSFTPLVSFYTVPPNEIWPTSGSRTNTTTQIADVNSINGNEGYQFGVLINSGGPVTIDHSDFWGFGNAIDFMSTTAQIVITNSWIHDAANASSQSYHTDGPGYLNSATGPNNVLIQGNTIASLGNTNGIAFQAATGGYNNIQVIGNYLSGFGYQTALSTTGNMTGSTFENNVFGTDVQWVWGPVYGNDTAEFTGNGNTWFGNTLVVISGTTKASTANLTFSSGNNGNYLWPDSSLHTSDFSTGDTIAPSVSISSPANGSTVSGTVTISGSASDNVAISSVAVSVDGGVYTNAAGTTSWSYSLNTTILTNGSHTITAKATDSSGNTNTASITVTVNNVSAGNIFYVDFSSGSDANNGTSKATPWKHAPGMNGVTGLAAAHTIAPGDTFILKGGSIWDYTIWPWNAGSGNASVITTGCSGSGCVKYTTDQTWYNSAACMAKGYSGFCRPVLSGGGWQTVNTSCYYNAGAAGHLFIGSYQKYWILDDMEFTGMCTTNPSLSSAYVTIGNGSGADYFTISNDYFHGALFPAVTPAPNSANPPAGDYWAAVIGASSSNTSTADQQHSEFEYNVVDGSDATGASNGSDYASGEGVYGAPNNVYYNVFYHITDSLDPALMRSIHDNFFNNGASQSISQGANGAGTHPHLMNVTGNQPQSYLYNNVAVTVGSGQGWNPSNVGVGSQSFVFNNVLGDCTMQVDGGNCVDAFNLSYNAGTTGYVFNNTCEGGPDAAPGPQEPCFRVPAGTLNFYNNHIITSAAGGGAAQVLNSGATINAGSADIVVQSQSVANAQGYALGQTYMFSPTVSTNATVGVGVNETAYCNLMTDAAAQASCKQDTTYAVIYDMINHLAIPVGHLTTARPSSGVWDSGAYQYSSSGSGGDTTPPTVAITSPVNAATASSTITVSANASDNVGVVKVEFYLDGILQTIDASTPYTWSWNTATVANGSHVLSAMAYDAAGNVGASANVTVTVSNADTTPPSVPTRLAIAGTTTSTISLSWSASTDNIGVAGYKIYRGGIQVGTSTLTSFTNVNLAASTTYSYTVSAYDVAGNNSSQSSAVQGTTKSASGQGDITPPSVAIVSPTNNQTVVGVITILGSASDNVAVSSVALSIDGGSYGTVSGLINWTATLDTTTLTNGNHTLTAKATDSSGNTNTTSITINVQNTISGGGGSGSSGGGSSGGGGGGGGGSSGSSGGSSTLPPATSTTATTSTLSTDSSSSLEAILTSLLTELESLIGQLNAQLVATFTRNLTIGSSGTDVKNLQVFLNDNGYTVASSGAGSPGDEATYFGAKTQAALAKFQAANHLPDTGYFGSLTRQYMEGKW